MTGVERESLRKKLGCDPPTLHHYQHCDCIVLALLDALDEAERTFTEIGYLDGDKRKPVAGVSGTLARTALKRLGEIESLARPARAEGEGG